MKTFCQSCHQILLSYFLLLFFDSFCPAFRLGVGPFYLLFVTFIISIFPYFPSCLSFSPPSVSFLFQLSFVSSCLPLKYSHRENKSNFPFRKKITFRRRHRLFLFTSRLCFPSFGKSDFRRPNSRPIGSCSTRFPVE